MHEKFTVARDVLVFEVIARVHLDLVAAHHVEGRLVELVDV